MRASFVLAAWLVTSVAAAQLTPLTPLPAGWAQRADRSVSSPQDVACTATHAYVRSWSGDVAVWDGTSVARLPALGRNAYGRTVGASSDGHVFLQSDHDVAHYDGASWSFVPVDQGGHALRGSIEALLAIDARHVYFATAGAIGALDGARFALFDAGTWRDLHAIDGTSATDLWVAGQGGTVMHWDGARWSREATNVTEALTGLHVIAADDVWAWGGEVLVHRDASGWSAAEEGLSARYGTRVTGMAGSGAHLYAAGAFGIARRDGSTWAVEVPIDAFGSSASAITGVCNTSRELVVVRSGGEIVTRPID